MSPATVSPRRRPNQCDFGTGRICGFSGAPSSLQKGREAIGARCATVLPAYGELDSQLTRGSRTSAKRRGRRPERRHDVVRVREVSSVGGDSPPAMTGPVFDAGPQQAIWSLPLYDVIERRVEDGGLRRHIGRDRQSSRVSDVAAPLDPEAPRPLRGVVQPVPRHVSGQAAVGDRDVLIVGGVEPCQMAPGFDAAPNRDVFSTSTPRIVAAAALRCRTRRCRWASAPAGSCSP